MWILKIIISWIKYFWNEKNKSKHKNEENVIKKKEIFCAIENNLQNCLKKIIHFKYSFNTNFSFPVFFLNFKSDMFKYKTLLNLTMLKNTEI